VVTPLPPGWNPLPIESGTVIAWQISPRGNILVGFRVPGGAYVNPSPRLPAELRLTPAERRLGAGIPSPPLPPPTSEEIPSLSELRRRFQTASVPPPPPPRGERKPRARVELRRGYVAVIPAEAIGTLRIAYAAATRSRSALAQLLRTAAYAIQNARIQVVEPGMVVGSSFVPRTAAEEPTSAAAAEPRLAPVTYPTAVALLRATFDLETLRRVHAERLIPNRFANYMHKIGWAPCGKIRGTTILVWCPPVVEPAPARVQEAASEFMERGEDLFMRPPTA
jgi:hypothetical protein